MEARAARMDGTEVPLAHRYPARPDAEAVLCAIVRAFNVERGAVEDRRDQGAFQAWVYLMRRASNLSLNAVARRAGVSAGRVSQIQSAMEAGVRSVQVRELLDRYKVKN